MTAEIRVPRLAESISEAVLVQWLKQDGDTVRTDEPIATLETDKAAVEIPSDRPGVLRHARKVGETVAVGDVIARVEEGNGEPAAARSAAAPAASESAKPAPAAAEPAKPAPAAAEPAKAAASTPSKPASSASPAAPSSQTRAPAPAPMPPPSRAASAPPAPSRPPTPAPAHDAGEGQLSPAVRRMIEEFGLDPAEITATGKGGRLLKEDVQRHLEGAGAKPVTPPTSESPAAPAPSPAASASPAVTPKAAPWTEGESQRAVPMSRIRQKIAERLVQAQRTAAILTTFNEVDMSAVMEMRARFKDGFEKRHGVRLSFMSFFTRACVLALQQVPEINAQIRGTDIVYQRHVHMGIAVQTGRGLVVPVVRGADQRTFADLEKEIARLALAARDNRVTLDELSGGTFTISNGGVFGSLLSTPILNPPQSGILGMHKIEKRPVVVDDQIVIRSMMYLALSYDHRIVDGEQAVTFLASVKQRLEDPERMLLDL